MCVSQSKTLLKDGFGDFILPKITDHGQIIGVMRKQNRREDVVAENERSLVTLSRAITLSQGNFALILVRCNYELCFWQMWQRLQMLSATPLSSLVLPKSIKTLFPSLLTVLPEEPISTLVVLGLESVVAIDQVLISTNQVRDEFRKRLTFPLVLWTTDEVLQKLTRFAPDFKSWAATSIKFDLATDELINLWQQTTDQLLATLLANDKGEFVPNSTFNLAPGCRRRQELESARRDLQARKVNLEPEFIATWHFILGRDAFSYNQIDIALEQYQQALETGNWGISLGQDNWTTGQDDSGVGSSSPTPHSLECTGLVLVHIAWCYCRQAQLQRFASVRNWKRARVFFDAAIKAFIGAGRLDWVAQLSMDLGEVLQRLQNWSDLEALALQCLAQPQTQNNRVQLAQAYGFLAAVALARLDGEDAQALAQAALDTLEQSHCSRPQHRGLYLLLLAKAQRRLSNQKAAITALEQAITQENWLFNSNQHPQLCLDILEELRSLYYEQQQYLRAFELKQKQRFIEQQYGFCTFIGATPLQPLTQPNRGGATLEITAAGRQADVNRLIERLSRNDHKLTILHGASGVGKSSLISAGLVPTLETRIINAREPLPVVHKDYRNWAKELANHLATTLNTRFQEEHSSPINAPASLTLFLRTRSATLSTASIGELQPPYSDSDVSSSCPKPSTQLAAILEQLRLASERNLFTILIFDQFEEFFFVCPSLKQRCQFYEFLSTALNLPFVKVILSLREEYLHYLLECERYCSFNPITNNILDRQRRYPLGDLSPSDAKNVICTLVRRSQFQLEDSLIETLVQNLARRSGAVRLIELQVVGQALQAEKITTLKQYQALGEYPIATLIERSLLNVISDCGQDNEDQVWSILFALTDERGTRPSRTKLELIKGLMPKTGFAQNLSVAYKSKQHNFPIQKSRIRRKTTTDNNQPTLGKLELILKILVGSGLVFRVPEEPHDRYQLVHDYLIKPIRQSYKRRIQVNWSAQIAKREMELLRVRQQRVQAIAIGVTMAVLAGTVGGLGWRAEVQRRLMAGLSLNAQLSAMSASSEALLIANKKFDALLEGVRAAKQLQQAQLNDASVKPDTYLQVITALEQAVYGVSERNRLEGHRDVVWNVSFAPDGTLMASASRDHTVKLWQIDGTLMATLNGHTDSVTSVAFSPDSQLIASGSWDGTVNLWSRQGKMQGTLRGHTGHVLGVSFSPKGQIIASAGSDRSIRLWTVDGKLLRTWFGHEAEVRDVSFSPDGETIASVGVDQTIKLWTSNGTLLHTLNGHQARVNSVAFSPDGQIIASASDDQTVKLWSDKGKLLKTLPKHSDWVIGVAFSPDGQFLASASADKTIRLWTRQGTLLKSFTGHSDSVTSVSFSPVAGWPKPRGQGEKQHKEIQTQGNNNVSSRSSEPPHPLLASTSFDKTIKLWEPRQRSRLILRGHQARVTDVTFSPDGERLASASDDTTVKIWSRTGKILNTLRGHRDRVLKVSFSSDGQQLATASRDSTVKLWTRDGTLIKTLKGHSNWVLDVSFSPDGTQLASASRDGTVKLWNRQGTLLKTLTGHQKRVNAVRFSTDGQELATASDDQTIKLWTAEGQLLKTLPGHDNWVLDVSFSPDSKLLASASYDNTVKLWSRDGKLMRTFQGHTDSVAHVRFSPSGQILATTSWDNRIQLWRLDDTLINSLEGHKKRVTSVSWSLDGKALASASEDHTIIVWNLDLENLLDKSCSWLQDYLQTNPKVRPSDRQVCQPLKPKEEGTFG